MDKTLDNVSDARNNDEDNAGNNIDYMADIEVANVVDNIIFRAEMDEMNEMEDTDDDEMLYDQVVERNVDMLDDQNNIDDNAINEEHFDLEDDDGSDYTLGYSSDEDIFDDLMDYDDSSAEEDNNDKLANDKLEIPKKVNFSVHF